MNRWLPGWSAAAGWQIAILAVVLLLTALVYWPGMAGPFVFDDHANFVDNPEAQIEALDLDALQTAWNSGLYDRPLDRQLTHLTFGLNHALFGPEPRSYKVFNLVVHLLTGLAVFGFARLLARIFLLSQPASAQEARRLSGLIGLLTAAVWLLAPINLTGVLYVVQRATSLSALFVLLALWVYLAGRWRSAVHGRSPLLVYAAVLPLAGLGLVAKENAALLPLLIVVVELTIGIHPLRAPLLRRSRLDQAVLATCVLVLLGAALYLLLHPGYLGYGSRPYDMLERLLTQARALWMYVQMIIVPWPGSFGLYHDDTVISRGLTLPWQTLPAVLGWCGALLGALVALRYRPVIAFAVLFFVAGHALESSIFPLELVFEHRNYLPAVGLMFALVFGVVSWLNTPRAAQIRTRTATLALLLWLGASAAVTHARAWDWHDPVALQRAQLDRHPDSARANDMAAQTLIGILRGSDDPQLVYRSARFLLERAATLAPRHLNIRLNRIRLDLEAGLPVDDTWIETTAVLLRDGLVGPLHFSLHHLIKVVIRPPGDPGQLSVPQADQLLEALLANPRLGGRRRADVHILAALYFLQRADRPARAREHATAALALLPEGQRLPAPLRVPAVTGDLPAATGQQGRDAP